MTIELPEVVEQEFKRVVAEREEEPEKVVLSHLVREYVQQGETVTAMFGEDTGPVNTLDEYDPSDERPLGRPALESLPAHHGEVEIDPCDIDEGHLPQSREVRRHVILAIVRYRCPRTNRHGPRSLVVRRDEVVGAAETVIGDLETDYKRREYVEKVMDDLMLRHPYRSQMAFLSPADALTFLRSLKPGLEAENHHYYLGKRLADEHPADIDVEALNEARARLGLDPLPRRS